MPKKTERIILQNANNETVLAACYQAFKNLDWTVLFASENMLQAQTIKKWNSYPQQVFVEVNESELIVTSEMNNGEMFDAMGKNRSNISKFTNAFEAAAKNMEPAIESQNLTAINDLRNSTRVAIEQEITNQQEIDEAMNLSGSNLYVTYGIMAINLIIFLLMVVNGAGIFDVNGYVHIKWGSNYSPLTLSGDWWRLLTNVFIHFGVIHIVMNMYCLYMVGVYLEPMLGKIRYVTAYLCTGVLASLASLWWHKAGINSAGASGAIFGLYGLFLALLTTSLIPKTVRDAQLKSIGLFVVYNLVYGMKGGVDNAAHIGGLISGLLIGYVYAISIKKERQQLKASWALPVIVVITIATAITFLRNNEIPVSERNAILNEVKSAGYEDADKFNEGLNAIIKLEETALKPIEDSTLSNQQLKEKVETICFPAWTEAEDKLKAMQNLRVSISMKQKADKLLEYVSLRKKELDVINKITDTGDQQGLIEELNDLRMQMGKIAEEISKL